MTDLSRLGRLGKLPLEVRIQFYDEFMPWHRPYNPRKALLPLLRTSRAIYEEVTDLLYRGCRFEFIISIAYALPPSSMQPLAPIYRHSLPYPTVLVKCTPKGRKISRTWIIARGYEEQIFGISYHLFSDLEIVIMSPAMKTDNSNANVRPTRCLLTCCFEASMLGASMLKKVICPPDYIRVVIQSDRPEDWVEPGQTETEGNSPRASLPTHLFRAVDCPVVPITGTKSFAGGLTDLYILLAPFGLLNIPVTVHTTKRIASYHFTYPDAQTADVEEANEEHIAVELGSLSSPCEKDSIRGLRSLNLLADKAQLDEFSATIGTSEYVE